MSFIYKENSLSSKHGTEILFKSQSSDNTTPSDAIKFIKTDKGAMAIILIQEAEGFLFNGLKCL